LKKTHHKKGVAQGVGPEVKLSTAKKKKPKKYFAPFLFCQCGKHTHQ
jgi:hypothetical protein